MPKKYKHLEHITPKWFKEKIAEFGFDKYGQKQFLAEALGVPLSKIGIWTNEEKVKLNSNILKSLLYRFFKCLEQEQQIKELKIAYEKRISQLEWDVRFLKGQVGENVHDVATNIDTYIEGIKESGKKLKVDLKNDKVEEID